MAGPDWVQEGLIDLTLDPFTSMWFGFAVGEPCCDDWDSGSWGCDLGFKGVPVADYYVHMLAMVIIEK